MPLKTNILFITHSSIRKYSNNGNSLFGDGGGDQYDDDVVSMSDAEGTPPPPYSVAVQLEERATTSETVPLTSAVPFEDSIDENDNNGVGTPSTTNAADQHLYEYPA